MTNFLKTDLFSHKNDPILNLQTIQKLQEMMESIVYICMCCSIQIFQEAVTNPTKLNPFNVTNIFFATEMLAIFAFASSILFGQKDNKRYRNSDSKNEKCGDQVLT